MNPNFTTGSMEIHLNVECFASDEYIYKMIQNQINEARIRIEISQLRLINKYNNFRSKQYEMKYSLIVCLIVSLSPTSNANV